MNTLRNNGNSWPDTRPDGHGKLTGVHSMRTRNGGKRKPSQRHLQGRSRVSRPAGGVTHTANAIALSAVRSNGERETVKNLKPLGGSTVVWNLPRQRRNVQRKAECTCSADLPDCAVTAVWMISCIGLRSYLRLQLEHHQRETKLNSLRKYSIRTRSTRGLAFGALPSLAKQGTCGH